jgi:hypothetical protein
MKYASPSVALYVDGYDLTPALVSSIGHSNEILTQPSNPFGAGAVGDSPIGLARGVLTVGNGLFDKTVDPLHAAKVPDGGVGVSRVACVFEQGQTKGVRFTGYRGAYSQKAEVLDVNDGLTKANVAYIIDGEVDEGVIVQEAATHVADWDTHLSPVDAAADPTARRVPIVSSSAANPTHIVFDDPHGFVTGDVIAIFGHTSVTPDINDDATAEAWTAIGHTVTVVDAVTISIPVNVSDGGVGGYAVLVSHAGGGRGYQQVLEGASLTAFFGTIKHSVDASTWATLISFADTATDYHDAQSVATALATTQVRRYLAYYGDGTGWGTNKVMAGFARG